MSAAPETCAYCGGTGRVRGNDDHECGFCEGGKPLDTQADWDASWGRILRDIDSTRSDRSTSEVGDG